MTRSLARRRARPRAGRRSRARRSWARRLLDFALAAAILGLVALVAARMPLGPAETVGGVARVADGDSLAIGDTRIRLEGIDAPELGQTCSRNGGDYPCGREARDALARLVGNGAVSCESRRQDRYGRLLARCTAGSVELNRAMVEEGWAVAYGGYMDAEDAARRAGRGLWAGSFERPQDWRRVHGGLAEDPHGGLFNRLRDMLSGWMTGENETGRGGDLDEAF